MYNCRGDDHILVPPPLGKSRQDTFCQGCPSGPYRSRECLFGRDPEMMRTAYLNHRREQEEGWVRQAERLCPVCDAPLSDNRTMMHQQCWGLVSVAERKAINEGDYRGREEIIETVRMLLDVDIANVSEIEWNEEGENGRD